MDEYIQKSEEIASKMRETEDEAEKDRLKKEWFDNAVDAFNNEIAGEVTLADGRKINIPTL